MRVARCAVVRPVRIVDFAVSPPGSARERTSLRSTWRTTRFKFQPGLGFKLAKLALRFDLCDVLCFGAGQGSILSS